MGKKDPHTGGLKTENTSCGTGHRLHGRRNSPHQRSNERQFCEKQYGTKIRLTPTMARDQSSQTKEKYGYVRHNTATP